MQRHWQRWFGLVGLLVMAGIQVASAEVPVPVEVKGKVLEDVSYKPGRRVSEYEAERCKLDVYLPEGVKQFPVVVWFHGGGLTGGDKRKETEKVAQYWAKNGVAVVSANYRLSPKVKFPAYLEDGAAAVKWAKDNMGAHGADVSRIFVGGHSAGAYMALLIGMDERYLKAVGLSGEDLAGLLPVSGQTMTHFTVREERGLPKDRVIADEAAPIHFVGKDGPPTLLLMGDKDWPARLEENAYYVALSRSMKNEGVHLLTVKDRTHGTIFSKLSDPEDVGGQEILRFIQDPKGFKLTAPKGEETETDQPGS